jgi:hypothetical protein
MPRFFFHVEDGESYTDLQGTELPDIEAARHEAVRFAAALLHDQAERFWDSTEWRVRVTNDVDLTLFELTFFGTQAPATRNIRPS